jgi:hypothetical protein
MPENGSTWVEYQRLVLSELERHTKELQGMHDEIAGIRIEIAMLKVKAGVWGALAGMIPVTIALLIWLIQRS